MRNVLMVAVLALIACFASPAHAEPSCLERCNAEYRECRGMAYSMEAILACSDARNACLSNCGSGSLWQEIDLRAEAMPSTAICAVL